MKKTLILTVGFGLLGYLMGIVVGWGYYDEEVQSFAAQCSSSLGAELHISTGLTRNKLVLSCDDFGR